MTDEKDDLHDFTYKELEQLYDGVPKSDWLEELNQTRFHTRRHLFTMYGLFGTPGSMLDIGCGLGETVFFSRRLGVDCWGVDQIVDKSWNKDWFFHHNLQDPFSLAQQGLPSVVDLVLCWEVAEHIPGDKTHIFMDTCANHLKNGENSFLVFTAAHPGQGGIEHTTERSSQFWRDQFHERGLKYQENKTRKLALLWTNIDSPLWWLGNNVQVFAR